MNVIFEASFARDLKKIREKTVLNRIERAIGIVKDAETLQDIAGLTKLRGYADYYRLRIGDYRIGVQVIENSVMFVRVLHRKDIYRYFP